MGIITELSVHQHAGRQADGLQPLVYPVRRLSRATVEVRGA